MRGTNYVTPKEKSYLQDALQIENLHIAKCNVYADQFQNQELKSLMLEIVKSKRQHCNKIKQLLGQTDKELVGQQFH